MQTEFWLTVPGTIKSWGVSPGGLPKTTRRKPTTEPNEVAVKVTLDLPDSLFKRPTVTANITVPESDAPVEITAEVQDNLAAIIESQLGVRVTITADPPATE